jgi:hypothetical protein
MMMYHLIYNSKLITLSIITIIISLLSNLIHSKIIHPPDQYSVDHLFKIADKQKSFVLDSYQIRDAYVNPSIIEDENNNDNFIMVRKHV